MALSDGQLQSAWGRRCPTKSARVKLYGAGTVSVQPAFVEATLALSQCLKVWDYPTRAADTGAGNCRHKTSGDGWSIHAWWVAIDINWKSNPYGPRLITNMPRAMVGAIKAIRTNNGKQVFTWGGDWDGNKDAMHFQAACGPRDLATGINWGTVAGFAPSTPAPPTTTPPPVNRPAPIQEEDDMYDQAARDEVMGALTELTTIARATHPAIADIQQRTVSLGQQVTLLVNAPKGAAVDVQALAQAILAGLGPTLASSLANDLANRLKS